jgi:hypothetical protein
MIKTSNFKILWHACTSRNQILWKIWKFEIWIFLQKRLFQIKTAITFAYRLKKTYNIWKTIYTKFYIRFQWPMAVCTIFCFSKFQREIWKQEDFRFCEKKWEKMIFFSNFFISFVVSSTFRLFWSFLLILEFFKFFDFFLNILSLKINN